MTYAIRNLTLAEVQTAVDWAAAEGWNPGLHDAACFYAADPTGFWGGFVGEDLVATLAAVKYGEGFGFIGLYIVKPEFRGHGLGMALWNAGMATLQGRRIGLDYDRPFFPDDRQEFLRHWVRQPGAVALGLLRAGGQDSLAGGLAGYGVLRPTCRCSGCLASPRLNWADRCD